MSPQAAQKIQPQLDLSDVDHRVGKLVGGGQLWEPCTAMDIDGEVTAKEAESAFGVPLVSVKVRMTNQDGVVLVDGVAELELPLG
jgi:hypothetical protein